MPSERLEHVPVGGAELARLIEEQVEHAEHLIAQPDRERSERLEPGAGASIAFVAADMAAQRVNAAAVLRCLAAQAPTPCDAALCLPQRGGHAFLREQMHVAL